MDEVERYQATLKRRGLGWTASISLTSGRNRDDLDKIPMGGPTFWRPTRNGVVARADRCVRFRAWRQHRTRRNDITARFGEAQAEWLIEVSA